VEQRVWGCCEAILKIIRELDYVPDDLEGLEKGLADTYYGNFSVFQSAPDHWAVKQLFPTMPLHRLNERPSRRGVIADLTCDSDGKMDQFIELRDAKNALVVQRVRQANEEALRRGLLTFEESALLMRRFEDGLSGYTYLEKEEPAPRIANGTKGLTSVSQSPGAEPAVPAERAVTGAASSKE